MKIQIIDPLISGMVSPVVEKLLLALIQEAQHSRNFHKELRDMRQRLGNIKLLLSNKSHQNIALIEIRDFMFEADDILTDCMVIKEYQGFFFNICPQNFLFRHKTAKKLEGVNQRMEQFFKIAGEPAGQLRVADAFAGSGQTSNTADPETETSTSHADPCFIYEYEDEEIVGLDNDMETLKEWILEENYKLRKIGIVGMGGLGKTTIAKKIYNDEQIHRKFYKRVWVSVSQTYREREILTTILRQLGNEDEESNESPLQKIISMLGKYSCIIILDDIWDDDDKKWWKEKFFFLLSSKSDKYKQSCIIITTRDQKVATDCKVDIAHNPSILDVNNSWSLFLNHAFPKDMEPKRRKEFELVGKEIQIKCGGLPLAIKTIGGLLRSESDSLDKWRTIRDSFSEVMTEENNEVMTSLRLSYKALPIHLQRCLIFFSIFPEDFTIDAENLIHWWVVEGLIQRTEFSKTEKEMGFQYLSILVSRCLVEFVDKRGYDGKVYNCKMHDMVRELTLKLAKEEKIGSFDKGRQQFTEDSRWLGFTSEMVNESLKKCPKLRALLLMMTRDQAPFNFDQGLCSLQSLRSLDLSNNKLDSIALKNLLNLISSLKRLAYLNLSGAEELQEVPNSIRKLRNLQFFVLSGCINLSKLNPAITCLRKLLVLDLDSCHKLQYLPRGLGRSLSKLQELSGFRLGRGTKRRSCSFLELEELQDLRVLRMRIVERSEIKKDEQKVLSELKQLKVVSIDFDETEESENSKKMVDIIDRLSAPPNLKELYLKRYPGETLPRWISPENLPKLVYLCIENGSLADIPKGKTTDWKVEGLCLKLLPELKKDWKSLKEEMPLLRYAEVRSCPHINNFENSDNSKQGIWRNI